LLMARWLTLNATNECKGSMVHVPAI
jgi:hypothetical protein